MLHESATGIAHRRELDSRIGYRNHIHESPCETGLRVKPSAASVPASLAPLEEFPVPFNTRLGARVAGGEEKNCVALQGFKRSSSVVKRVALLLYGTTN